MKVSKLIKALKTMQDTYGDLVVNFSTCKKYDVTEEIFLRYEQFEDHDEISISDFPY